MPPMAGDLLESNQNQTHNPKYTKYEMAKIVGARALQIAMGAPVLISVDANDPIEIAIREMEEGAVPITVKRGPL